MSKRRYPRQDELPPPDERVMAKGGERGLVTVMRLHDGRWQSCLSFLSDKWIEAEEPTWWISLSDNTTTKRNSDAS